MLFVVGVGEAAYHKGRHSQQLIGRHVLSSGYQFLVRREVYCKLVEFSVVGGFMHTSGFNLSS